MRANERFVMIGRKRIHWIAMDDISFSHNKRKIIHNHFVILYRVDIYKCNTLWYGSYKKVDAPWIWILDAETIIHRHRSINEHVNVNFIEEWEANDLPAIFNERIWKWKERNGNKRKKCYHLIPIMLLFLFLILFFFFFFIFIFFILCFHILCSSFISLVGSFLFLLLLLYFNK